MQTCKARPSFNMIDVSLDHAGDDPLTFKLKMPDDFVVQDEPTVLPTDITGLRLYVLPVDVGVVGGPPPTSHV